MAAQTEAAKVPQLRFPEFNGEWKVANLGELTHLITKGTTPNNFSDKGINFVKIEGLNGIHIKKEKCLFIDEFTHSNTLRRSMLKECDILFAIAGATVGKVGLVTAEILPANTNQALAIIRLKDKEYLNYILQILQSRVMKKYIYSSVSVGAQPNLSLKQINDFSFAFPGVLEQQKIAAFLSAFDSKIELLRQKQELLGEYKKGLMQQIFSQVIRFEADDGSDFPEWEEKRLGELEDNGNITMRRGSVISKQDILEHTGNYPIYSSSVKNNGFFGNYGKYMFDEELITWSVDGGGHFFYRPKHKFSITNVSGYLRILDKSINYQFLAFQLQELHKKIIFDYQLKAHPSVIRKLYSLYIPSIEEQLKIANFLSSVDSKIEQVGKQLDESKQFKKALLQQMFV